MVPESDRGTWRHRWVVLCAVFWLAGCAPPGSHEMLNAVLWQRQAAEYRAVTMQTYVLATTRLDEALADPDWSAALEQVDMAPGLPPAVILDVDETVLDNSPYEARIVTDLGEYSPGSFARWCESATPAAVAGAVEFINAARARGVQVIYYTARHPSLRACTLRALRAIGISGGGPITLFLRDAGSKSKVRERLARDYRILLLVGDNLEDFVEGSKADPQARLALVRRHESWFGRRWIVLPNPVYGHWEAAYYGFDYDVPREDKIRRKRSTLDPRARSTQ